MQLKKTRQTKKKQKFKSTGQHLHFFSGSVERGSQKFCLFFFMDKEKEIPFSTLIVSILLKCETNC